MLSAVAAALVAASITGTPLSAEAATVSYLYAKRAIQSWKYSTYDYHTGGNVIGATLFTEVRNSNGTYTSTANFSISTSYARAWNMERCVWWNDPQGGGQPMLLSCEYKT